MRFSVRGAARRWPGIWLALVTVVLVALLAAAGLAQSGTDAGQVTPVPEAPRTPELVAAPTPVGSVVPAASAVPVASTTPFIVAPDPVDDARPPRLTPTVSLSGSDLSSETRQRLGAALRLVKGSVLERSFRSASLGKDMPYLIYLPPGFGQAPERYPVLYILHGRGGARTDWATSGLLEVADRGMQSAQATRFLIVFPEGYDGYWTNHAGNSGAWGDYLVRDLVAHVDATYPTVPQAGARAIGGDSMGGWGALHHAFSHPEVFGVVGAHSPALRPDDGTLAFLGSGAEFAKKDPISLARQLPSTVPLKIWIDTGKDDPWADRATLLHNILTERGVVHAWNAFQGDHSWTYWRAHVLEYVRFYSQALAQTAVAP